MSDQIVAITVLEVVLLLVVASMLAAARPWLAKRSWKRVPAKPTTAVVSVGVLAMLVSIGIAVCKPHTPRIHDEFSNLLIADTLLEGRLANPTHPMWPHFETFYVLQTPSYASMYPPAQGGLLALGRLLVGNPIGGVCLGVGLAAASVCWMLQGWLPLRWALLGGLMIALHSSLQVGWFNYWGGVPAMIGGSLMFGAWGRHLKSPAVHTSILLALGAVILGFSRPFEGLVVSIPVACSVFLSTVASRSGRKMAAVLLPAGAVLLLGAGALALYNSAITGSPTVLPATVWGRQYSARPIFLWQQKRPAPEVCHEVMSGFVNRRSEWEMQQSLSGFLAGKSQQFLRLWRFYLGAALTIPLITLPSIVRSGKMRKVLLILLLLCAMSCTVAWLWSHYWSAVFSLILLVVLQGMRHCRVATRKGGRDAWKWVLPSVICTFFLANLAMIGIYSFQPERRSWGNARQEIQAQLAASGDRHLVVVHYTPTHVYHDEWVYNAANIDASSVVWARDMGSQNEDLLEYFHDRRVWLLEADKSPLRLEPYQAPSERFQEESNR